MTHTYGFEITLTDIQRARLARSAALQARLTGQGQLSVHAFVAEFFARALDLLIEHMDDWDAELLARQRPPHALGEQ